MLVQAILSIFLTLDFCTHLCLHYLNLSWAELSKAIQWKAQHCIKKEQFLCFNGKEFNVLRKSKGDDVCNTNSM
jgi:hypothetical protein